MKRIVDMFTISFLSKVPSNSFNSSSNSTSVSMSSTKLMGKEPTPGSFGQLLLTKMSVSKLYVYKQHFLRFVRILAEEKIFSVSSQGIMPLELRVNLVQRVPQPPYNWSWYQGLRLIFDWCVASIQKIPSMVGSLIPRSISLRYIYQDFNLVPIQLLF